MSACSSRSKERFGRMIAPLNHLGNSVAQAISWNNERRVDRCLIFSCKTAYFFIKEAASISTQWKNSFSLVASCGLYRWYSTLCAARPRWSTHPRGRQGIFIRGLSGDSHRTSRWNTPFFYGQKPLWSGYAFHKSQGWNHSPN